MDGIQAWEGSVQERVPGPWTGANVNESMRWCHHAFRSRILHCPPHFGEVIVAQPLPTGCRWLKGIKRGNACGEPAMDALGIAGFARST